VAEPGVELGRNGFRAGDNFLSVEQHVLVMGILNITPDSFSDGGKYLDPSLAVDRGLLLVENGADILDIGAESTRPGAEEVEVSEEIRRITPVLRELGRRISIPISIDTTKAAVAQVACDLGAVIVNDISAFRKDPGMVNTVARAKASVVIMHMKGTPQSMQSLCQYEDVVEEVHGFLRERIQVARDAGIAEDQIVVDPGIGFGKNTSQNLMLLKKLAVLKELRKPILVGVSQKSFIGHVLDKAVGDRMMGTAAAVTMAVLQGASMIRVHDVGPMREVITMAKALRDVEPNLV